MTIDLPDINLVGVLQEGKDTFLKTYTGKKVSILNPSEDDISLYDISHALSMQCRYNGHCSSFYSVAEHTVLGTSFMIKHDSSPAQIKAWLLHDATEAYVGDLIRPVKAHLQGFKDIEEVFATVINRKYGVELSDDILETIHYVDNVMVAWEKRDLMKGSKETWGGLPDISMYSLPVISGAPPQAAKMALKGLFDVYF